MPAVTIHMPRNGMNTAQLAQFKRTVMQSVATNMDAIDPMHGEKTKYHDNPKGSIDLVLVPYDPEWASLTTPFVATIVSYGWPDRMANIEDRLQRICDTVAEVIPMGMQPKDNPVISFTFLPKEPGSWAMNQNQ